MEKEKQAKGAELYFGMLAEMGITKHMGGKSTTNELVKLCRIEKDSHVLDIGCGVGKTACYLAKEVGCRVTGIDLNKGMVEWAKQRAQRKGLESRVEFKVADAQKLPFKDNEFDAVICESVTAFLPDKQKGVNEYVRVVKRGGFIGLNETTWASPPTPRLIDYAASVMGADFLEENGWRELLEKAGLKEIKTKSEKLGMLRQMKAEISWFELRDFLSPWHKVVLLFFKSKEYRAYLMEMMHMPLNIKAFLGHGIYTGKK